MIGSRILGHVSRVALCLLAISLVIAAHAAMSMLAAEGRENVFARHQRNADATRAAVAALGLPLFADPPTNAVKRTSSSVSVSPSRMR